MEHSDQPSTSRECPSQLEHSDQPSTSQQCPSQMDQPSTSQECPSQTDPGKKRLLVSEEELKDDAKRLDFRLEDCAKKFNLSALNVKNIIFHIIKDPHTLAALLDGDDNAIESLRLTRSRLREIEKVAQTKLNIELKPVSTKSTRPTLLDIPLSDDDEAEDPDYEPPPVEETTELEKYEFGEFTEEELAAENAFDNTEDWFGHDVGHQMETIYRDPTYAKFIEGCMDPNADLEYPEETDEDYNIVQDEEVLDLDEFRNDRSTRVSKRELRHLYDDIFPDDYFADEPNKKSKCKRRLSFDSRSTTPPGPFTQGQEMNQNGYYNANGLNHSDDLTYFDPLVASTSRQSMQEQVRQFEQLDSQQIDKVDAPKKSWSLLKVGTEPARFSNEELQCLKVQLEKHVQLLTQNVVAITGIPQLTSTRNQAVRMLHELDSKMYTSGDPSIYQIRNLPEAVITCHEIEAFDDALYEPMFGSNGAQRYSEPSFAYKSAVVLAKSRALIYPELLPSTQPLVHAAPFSNFIAPEQMLLALALFELHHVPHSTGGVGRIVVSKYQTISTYFLPNKTPNQIRNHLKNVRSGSGTSPLHQLIMFAEQGKFNATVELDNGLTQKHDPPIDWPRSNLLPRWLQTIQNLRFSRDSLQLPPIVQSIQSVESTEFPHAAPSTPIIQQPNYSMIQLYDGQVQMVAPQLAHLNGATLNSQAQVVVLNGQSHIVLNQPNVPTINRIPNSPFQSYTIKNEPTVLEKADMPEVIVIDNDGESVPVQQMNSQMDGQETTGNDDGDIIEVIEIAQTPQHYISTPTMQVPQNTPNYMDQFEEPAQEFGTYQETIYELEQPPTDVFSTGTSTMSSPAIRQSLNLEAPPTRKLSAPSQINPQITIQNFDRPQQQTTPQSNQTPQQKTEEPKVENEKMSRRREQITKCMKGFDDPEVIELWSSMVLQTVYNLVKQRLFMHDGKYKTFISVLSNPKKSCADKYDELAKLLRDTQPELADCIAALMDDEDLKPDQKENTERVAYKCALEMMMNILIYFHGQQNANMKRRLLKVIRDFCFTEQNLREEMQKMLSGRHEPLWIRLKQYFRGERYKEKVDMSRAEEVSLAMFSAFGKELQGKHKPKPLDLRTEFVDLTTPTASQKLEQQGFKPNLRLKNGYLLLRTENGDSIPVNLCSPTKANQMEDEMQTGRNAPVIGSIFGPEHDRQLLFTYNSSKAHPVKAIEKFVRDQADLYPFGECPFNEENTKKRLNFLLELISTMTTGK